MMQELLVLKKVYLECKKPVEPSLSQSQNNNQVFRANQEGKDFYILSNNKSPSFSLD